MCGSIHSFVQRALRPTLSTVTEKNQTEFLSVDDVAFVAHLSPDDAVLGERVSALAESYRDRFSFAVSPSTKTGRGITCRNTINSVEHTVTDMSTVDALPNFVKLCSTPIIPELTRRNEMEYGSVSNHHCITGAEC